MEWKEILPSVIGGLIVGVCAIAGVYKTLQGQNRRDRDRQQEMIQGVLQAIYEELHAMWEQYNAAAESYWKEFEFCRIRREHVILRHILSFRCFSPLLFSIYLTQTYGHCLSGQKDRTR